MRKITLHSAALDRRGAYRDAGAELTVGAADNENSDISTEAAKELVDSGRATFQATVETKKRTARKPRASASPKAAATVPSVPATATAEEKSALSATEAN